MQKAKIYTSQSRLWRPSWLAGPDIYRIQTSPILISQVHKALATPNGVAPLAPPPSRSKKEQEALLGVKMRCAALTVLVVEDNEINHTAMLKQLEVLGYSAVVARNGRKGLHKWQSNWFDLVLTDCHMPIMDRFEMTQTIREEEIETCLERTPIIAVTANALHGESAKCLASGMDDYIPKPVEIGVLELKSFGFLGCNFAQKTAFRIRANFSAKNVRLT